MFQVQVLNKRPIPNSQRTIIFWLGLASGIPFILYLFFVLSASSWNIIEALVTVFQNDILILLTTAVCFGVIYYILSMPPKKIGIEIDDETIRIDDNTFDLANLVAWSVLELDTHFEFVIRLQDTRTPYQYIYIAKDEPDLKKTLSYFSNNFPYDEQLNATDRMHNFFRLLGVK